ncbi:MAG: hypothetical protein GW858_00365 [Sphingomonadales bacterium]|nr:hypothetical protein [Sphingomonadales bacterium]NCQ19829.1 hypothetical protein [Sphingomonadales bacterium]NCT02969.1 hypothetical protein [Sphingomonadales bacterium]
MIPIRASIVLVSALLGGCASADSLEGQRTVFNNPLAVPEIDRRGIGPQCNIDFGRDATCLGAPLIYPGKGRHASLGNGDSVRLTRAQVRILRERAELLEAARTAPPPASPPPEPSLPTADNDKP